MTEDDEELTPAGKHLREVYRTGTEAVVANGYVPCARMHPEDQKPGPNGERICIRPDGHD